MSAVAQERPLRRKGPARAAVTSALAPIGRRRVALLAAALLLSLVVATPAGARPSGKLVPPSGALLGAWVKPSSGWSRASLVEFEAMIGRKLDIDHRYYGWHESFPYSSDSWDFANGRIPMITWNATGLDGIRSGRYDGLVRSRAAGLKGLGRPLFLRFAPEMNGNWMPWDGYHNNDPGQTNGPAKFVQAWRRIHDIFGSVGASNVVWVWCPNWESVPHTAWNDVRNYYPGDAYVDWVCLDAYNWGTMEWWSRWTSLASMIAPIYRLYGDRKPIMVGETASTEAGGNKGQWIREAENAIKNRFPAVAALVWFNEVKETDWRVNSSSQALAGFQALAHDPYFATNGRPGAVAAPARKARARRCTILGSRRADRLTGTRGRDVICGRGGNDTIDGRAGADVIYGGSGSDRLRGGSGRDRIGGRGGRDVIYARDFTRDAVFGGTGVDSARLDAVDRRASVERRF